VSVSTNFNSQFSEWISSGVPFIFLLDFMGGSPQFYSFEEAASKEIYFNVKGLNNATKRDTKLHSSLKVTPVSEKTYASAFDYVKHHIGKGDSFLLNLTFKSQVETEHSLLDLFYAAEAPYKFYKKNDFVVFSPECFIKIENNNIYSFPMKGTIDATLPNAKRLLTENLKEQYEHNTIVDLIRNDLSKVAKEVHLKRYRYLEKIKSTTHDLYQSSSEISAKLPNNWTQNAGDIFQNLLPAGSISGAPKDKTLELIQQAESDPREYYTGIFGVYDNKRLESAVNIRYIEKRNGKFWFRSGGGITHLSEQKEEYQELINKIYVPSL